MKSPVSPGIPEDRVNKLAKRIPWRPTDSAGSGSATAKKLAKANFSD